MYRFVANQTFAGGFDMGMVQAGFELVHKMEQRGGFGMANCLANRDLLGHGWSHQACDPSEWEPFDVDVIASNPPCSGFSVMTDRKHRGVDAKVNQCMWVMTNYAALVKPQIIIMESVRPAFTRGRELMQALRANLEERSGLRYGLYHVMHDGIKVGGAAVRKRYFWVASQVPFGVDFPSVKQPTLGETIADLDGLAETWQLQPYRRPATWWSEPARSQLGVVDGHTTRTGLAHARALDLMRLAEELGCGWPEGWHIGQLAKHIYETYGCVPESWNHMKSKLISKDFHMGYTSVTRWDSRRQGRVITGGALDLVLHPHRPRFITHREAARIMGFPDDWRIYPLRHRSSLKLTWGKGITVQCGRWIGQQVARALDGEPGSHRGTLIGEREWLIKD